MDNIKSLLKKNIKLYIILGIIILLGTVGITFAIGFSNFKEISINSTTLDIDATIGYDTNSNGSTITNNGNMLPISDDLVTGVDVTDTRILKAKFTVTGNSDNSSNTIYDIALHGTDGIDCELKTSDLKWRLYKNETLLNSGTLSPTYDTMNNNRLVLTNTQEDLTTTTDEYVFLLWISESCSGDITECDPSLDQSKYLNKELNATIKLELSTKSKKTISRVTGSEGSCSYIETAIPVCNDVTYTGSSQTLITSSLNYNLINNTGINAGSYAVTLSLNDNYKWSDGSTDDKVVYCDIDKSDLTVTSLDQTVTYSNDIANNINNVSVTGLKSGHTLNGVTLNSTITDVGSGKIEINNVKIVDSDNEEVTYNYNIIKKNSGILSVSCLNIAEEPTVSIKEYTGNEVVGVTGGEHITIYGAKRATNIGNYSVSATPNENYCWSDYTNTTKEYTWSVSPIVKYDYITNGGTSSTSKDTLVAVGDNIDLSYTATKSGWTFIGWNTDKNATEGLTSLTMESDNITLYAIFKKAAITYTATTQKNVSSATGTATSVSCTIPEVYNSSTQDTSCTVTLPSNPYTYTNWTFNGWVKSTSTTTSTTSGSAVGTTLTLSSNTNIIATWKRIYEANWYYYNSGSQSSTTTSCTVYNGNGSCTFSLPSVVSSSSGINGTYYGVSTSKSSTTTTTTYNSVNLNYYSVYRGTLTATYTKDDMVTSIGSTSNSCIGYETTNGTTYTSNGCNVTLPTINVESGYVVLGWYNTSGTKYGDASTSVKITSSIELIAKARLSGASDYSYDNSTTKAECTDVQCMIDLLDE